MQSDVDYLIIGQGLAGSAIAWQLHWAGKSLFLVDSDDQSAASRVAAGLITPVTGKRFVKSPEFDRHWHIAKKFYRRVEQQTGQVLLEERAMIRLFADVESRANYLHNSDPNPRMAAWQEPLQEAGNEHIGVRMTPAGRLNVMAYLDATKSYFQAQHSYRTADLDLDSDLALTDTIQVPKWGLRAGKIIICTGAKATSLFPGVPNNRSRGEIITVKIPNYVTSEVVHRSIWIAPELDGRQTVGSTYDWTDLESGPTQKGRSEILEKLRRVIDGNVEVVDHVAGVRPTMKDYEPVIGQHPINLNVFLLNGLGSKGTLRPPAMAASLVNLVTTGLIEKRYSSERLRAVEDISRPPLTVQAQRAVREVLSAGDTAIDATVGNGFDTCFMAELVGPTGRVIGFDVQAAAIESTRNRLKATNQQNVHLRLKGHETLADEVQGDSVAAVMFNLGYLPRSDHFITTVADTSVKAISAAVTALKQDGILTVLSYRGHEGGPEEFAAVERLLSGYLDRYDLSRIDSRPARDTSPVLFVLRKTSESANRSSAD